MFCNYMVFAALLGVMGVRFAHGAPPTAPVRRACMTEVLGTPCDHAASDTSWLDIKSPDYHFFADPKASKFLRDSDVGIVPGYARRCACNPGLVSEPDDGVSSWYSIY